MKRAVMAVALVGVLVLAASSAFASDRSDSVQPVKGIEGPDIRFVVDHPPCPIGTEGPDIRLW